MPELALPADARTAWRHRLRLGLECVPCCAGLMAILLVLGIMDLRAMALVVGAGLVLVARAIGPG
jgi:predicted metal-binding membrane protein